MQHYTTVEQSNKLVELGLNHDTADMFWSTEFELAICTPYLTKTDCETLIPACKESIPCWSLSALIDIMPSTIYKGKETFTLMAYKDVVYHVCYKSHNRLDEIWFSKENLLDATFEMVYWLLENNYIKNGE